ncbi:Uncharacterised protein [uncultured archaeon]|nr:Uncharacterised protein [uncultured archaeon]
MKTYLHTVQVFKLSNRLERLEIMIMRQKRQKKGFVYTLFVIAFLFSLMLFISLQKGSTGTSDVAEKIRADEVLGFAHAISGDIDRGFFISEKRALLSLTNAIIEGNGTFPANANASAKELLINGTFNGNPSDIMVNSTLANWTSSLGELGGEQRMLVNFSINDTNIIPASSFEVMFRNNVSVYIYDPFTKIAYNRTIQSTQSVPIDQLEDPYIAIKSLGTISNTFKRCASLEGPSYGGAWIYGKVYSSNLSSFPSGPWRNDYILVTNSTNSKDYSSFKAVVTETSTDVIAGVPYIVGANNSVSLSKTDSYAVLSSGTLWLANDTSCYFESPDGPSFFDRLEGSSTLSSKYTLPGRLTGLGAFILTFDKGWCMDYRYYGSGAC